MKNYTSSVPVVDTVSRIEQILIRARALNIMKEYDANGHISAICFTLVVSKETGQRVGIKLPADVDAVYRVLLKSCKTPPTPNKRASIAQQAPRTAWKLMQDWLEVQLSLIEMQQAEMLQVFLPYVWDGKQTLFSRFKESGFKGLPAPDSAKNLPEPEEN